MLKWCLLSRPPPPPPAHLEERQSKIQREVVDAKHGVTFVMVSRHVVMVGRRVVMVGRHVH